MKEPIILLENVNKYYPQGKDRLHVLKDISFAVRPGEFIAIEGRSGSGKSTLLNVIGCIDTFDSGNYFLEGRNIAKLGDSKTAAIRNKKIGYIFQDFCLLNQKSSLFNVMLPLFFDKTSYREMKKRARQALQTVGIPEQSEKKASQLSGGQRQRVAIARAIINQPSLILADEPTGALDTESSRQIMELLKELNNGGTTVLVVTHDSFVADCCSRRIRIQDGVIVE